jgi:hypothetical protein
MDPETAIKLFATNPAFISKFIYDRFGAGSDQGAGRQEFDAIDRPLPDRTEFPPAPSMPPGRTEYPANPPHLPDRLENPIPRPETPDPETFPDQSGEFGDFHVQEYKKLTPPKDWGRGEGLDPHSRAKLDSIRDPKFHEALRKHFLHNGVQDQADDRGTSIQSGRPASEGEWEFERLVQVLGKDPADVKRQFTEDGEPYRVYEDPRRHFAVNWREFSSEGNPTLEIQLLGVREKGKHYLLKKRYNPR